MTDAPPARPESGDRDADGSARDWLARAYDAHAPGL